MSIGDHLDELRRRTLLALAIPLPLAVVAFFFAPWIRAFLCEPAFRAQRASGMAPRLQVLNPVETISTDMQLALVVSLTLSAPWILWQLWKFVEPGLYASEKRFVRLLVPMSAALTVLGLALLQWVLMPIMLTFLVNFGGPDATLLETPSDSQSEASAPDAAKAPASSTDVAAHIGDRPVTVPLLQRPPEHPLPGQMWITPDHELQIAQPVGDGSHVELLTVPLRRSGPLEQQFRLREYLDFVLMLMLGTAVAFQLPLVILLLGWAGVVELPWLRSHRRHAIFVCAILAALITPTGDPISMGLLAVPLYGLYELGMFLLVVAPPSAVAQGTVLKRTREILFGRGRSAS